MRPCRRLFSNVPWFLADHGLPARPTPPHLRVAVEPPPLPFDAPQPVKDLHAQLIKSPLIDPSNLLVAQPRSLPEGPALPHREPQGRRKRGGTFHGESVYDVPGSLWSWIVMAQVKEGTETRDQ